MQWQHFTELWIASPRKSIGICIILFSNPICRTVYLCGGLQLNIEFQACGPYKSNVSEFCLEIEKLSKISSIHVLEQDPMTNKSLTVSSICLSILNHCLRKIRFCLCTTSTLITVSWKSSKFSSLDSQGLSMIDTTYRCTQIEI